MGMVKEFKEFALKGNVLDLAVGVIIGGAFGGIVSSLINDIIMPVVSMAGNANFKDLYLPLGFCEVHRERVAAANPGKVLPLPDAQKAGSVMAYGNFITIVINFLILAVIIFIVVKAFNTAKKRSRRKLRPRLPPARPPIRSSS